MTADKFCNSCGQLLVEEEAVEIVVILDRSGSMFSIVDDAIGGFNSFIKEQQGVIGKANLTLVQFDDQYEVVHDSIDLNAVPDLDEKTYIPRGSTALLDAIGRTISNHNNCDKVLVAILTDGYENCSHEYTYSAVQQLIAKKEEAGWKFLYLAADQDAIKEGGKFGFKAGDTFTFGKDAMGTRSAYRKMSDTTVSYRADNS